MRKIKRESWNHRICQVGRDPQGSESNSLLLTGLPKN